MSATLILRKLTEVLQDALNRCEHCGKEGSVFECEECTRNKVEFVEHVTDLVNLLEPDEHKRVFILIESLVPILETSPKTES